jgi:hypothetical protein
LVGKKKFGTRDVFEIKFECAKPNVYTTGYGYPSPASYKGSIYIDVISYAVLRYEAAVDWDQKIIKDLKYLKRFNVGEASNYHRSADFVYSYKMVKDQFVLHYARRTEYYRFSTLGAGKKINQIYQNEILSTGIVTDNPSVLTESKLRVNVKDIPYDKAFWDNFNFTID